MKLKKEQIQTMNQSDFEKIKYVYLKIQISKQLKVAGKTSNEFSGYIIGLTFPPLTGYLPNHIRFVEKSQTKGIIKSVPNESITDIFIPIIEQIELEEVK